MRAFSYPEVTTLEIGQSALIAAPRSEVWRKCVLYGARNGKAFVVAAGPEATTVTRVALPEPEVA